MQQNQKPGRRPAPGRRTARDFVTNAVRLVVAGAALVGAAACADAPASPAAAAAPQLAAAGRAPNAKGLVRATPIGRPVVTQLRVDAVGGSYALPGGLHVTVPAGVFDAPTTLTVTALPGRLVAYEFQPHGLVFRKPLVMRQELRGTDWQSRDAAKIEVGYFESSADISWTDGKARVREFLPVSLDPLGQRVQFEVHHFSGYMVTWGFNSDAE